MDKLINITVGYMIKVMKSGLDITEFRREFTAIRHGNYHTFIQLINEEVPTMVIYDRGIIRTHNKSYADDFDFAGMLKAGPSLEAFFNKCGSVYGNIVDRDISNDVYEKLASFELGLRMHATNNHLISNNENLIDVIDKISTFHNISKIDTEKLQYGREFINMVKHRKLKFPTWSEGVSAFLTAYETQKKHKLTIV